MDSSRRATLRPALISAALALLALPAAAQPAAWPDKPIKLVVPYPPGGLHVGLAEVLACPTCRNASRRWT